MQFWRRDSDEEEDASTKVTFNVKQQLKDTVLDLKASKEFVDGITKKFTECKCSDPDDDRTLKEKVQDIVEEKWNNPGHISAALPQ